MNDRLYECAVIRRPSPAQLRDFPDVRARLVWGPQCLIAESEDEARILVGRQISNTDSQDARGVEILIRPFVG